MATTGKKRKRNQDRSLTLKAVHAIDYNGSADHPEISFVACTRKAEKRYKVTLQMDDFDIFRFVEMALKHHKKIEESCIARLERGRRAFNYSSSRVKITYHEEEKK